MLIDICHWTRGARQLQLTAFEAQVSSPTWRSKCLRLHSNVSPGWRDYGPTSFWWVELKQRHPLRDQAFEVRLLKPVENQGRFEKSMKGYLLRGPGTTFVLAFFGFQNWVFFSGELSLLVPSLFLHTGVVSIPICWPFRSVYLLRYADSTSGASTMEPVLPVAAPIHPRSSRSSSSSRLPLRKRRFLHRLWKPIIHQVGKEFVFGKSWKSRCVKFLPAAGMYSLHQFNVMLREIAE